MKTVSGRREAIKNKSKYMGLKNTHARAHALSRLTVLQAKWSELRGSGEIAGGRRGGGRDACG